MSLRKCMKCGEFFESKRSDAQYCSKKCRNSANYQHRNPQKFNDSADKSLNKERPLTYSIKDIQLLRTKIMNVEQELADLIENRETLAKQVMKLKNGDFIKLQNRLKLSDSALYNGFLNKRYLERKNAGDSFADFSIVSANDLEKPSFKQCRLDVDKYRSNLQAKLDRLSFDVLDVEQQISFINERIELKKLKVTDLYGELTHVRKVLEEL